MFDPTPLAATYDPLLVVLSVLVAILASYTAFDLAARLRASEGLRRSTLLVASAVTLGGGIWSMHFVGMLAFSLPTPVTYDVWLTLLSLALPILVVGVAFRTICVRGRTVLALLASGMLMGGGIILMHYTGMAAMQMDAELHYRPALVGVSVAIAIGAATAALWLLFRLQAARHKLAAAVAMGAAISGMHYTGMAAAHFHLVPVDAVRSEAALDPNLLGVVIAATTMMALSLLLIWSIMNRRAGSAPAHAGDSYRLSARFSPGAVAPGISPRTGMLLLVLFFGLVLSVAWGISAWTDYDETIDRTRVTTRNTAQLLDEQMKRTIGEVDVVLQFIKRQVQAEDIESPQRWHNRLLGLISGSAQLGPITIVDAGGRVVLNTGPLPVGSDVSDRPYFRELATNPDTALVVSETVTGRISGQPFFSVSRRIARPDGSFGGVVAAVVYTDHFTSFYRTLELGKNASVTIVRTDGRILLREPAAERPRQSLLGTRLFTAELPAASAGTFEERSPVDGLDRIYSYRSIAGFPLVVISGVARATALQDWRYRLYRNAALAVVVFATVMGLSWLGLVGIQREDAARAALRDANAELDRRVNERTAQLQAALAEKDTLLREVHHRVKNNLQMIQALVRMTARRAPETAQSFFHDITRRIWAIGQVHNQVYGSPELGEIDLAEYLTRLIENVATGFAHDLARIKVRHQLAPLSVDIDRALPIGLLMVEMLTNAFKHAFPGGREGQIKVTLAQRETGAELVVEDDGVGLPAERSGSSMGLSLIDALVRQIDGRLEISPCEGTCLTLSFPVARQAQEGLPRAHSAA